MVKRFNLIVIIHVPEYARVRGLWLFNNDCDLVVATTCPHPLYFWLLVLWVYHKSQRVKFVLICVDVKVPYVEVVPEVNMVCVERKSFQAIFKLMMMISHEQCLFCKLISAVAIEERPGLLRESYWLRTHFKLLTIFLFNKVLIHIVCTSLKVNNMPDMILQMSLHRILYPFHHI